MLLACAQVSSAKGDGPKQTAGFFDFGAAHFPVLHFYRNHRLLVSANRLSKSQLAQLIQQHTHPVTRRE